MVKVQSKRFRYKKHTVVIMSYEDSWDKRIIIARFGTKVDAMYSFKHMPDAVKHSKIIINRINANKKKK